MDARALVWVREDQRAMEVSFVTHEPGRMAALGSVIATEPRPYRLSYTLETDGGYVTRRMTATAEGLGWLRTLELDRDGSGRWSARGESSGGADMPAPGGDAERLHGVDDVDIGYSPLTNTPPVLRRGLLEGGPPFDVDAAWVSVPDLSVQRLGQRYTFLRRDGDHVVVRYETRDGSFSADLTLGADGFVRRYPGLGTLAGP